MAIIAIAAALFASTTAIAFADDPEVEAETGETRELNESQLLKARLLADYFADYIVGDGAIGDTTDEGAAVEEISELRSGDTVVGWGAMFKLLQLAKAKDVTLSQLLTEIAGDDRGWAFGHRFKELGEDDPRKIADDTPKNLGQLKKQEREPKGNQGKKSQDD
jgi:hypothetical protein